MSKIDLHIVAFDVPYPADYGGVIDVFYRLKAFKEQGLKVALHCFQYGRAKHPTLEKNASEVNYYPRRRNLLNLLSFTPYIVKSRTSDSLINRLAADKAPILYEGIHCIASLSHPLLSNKTKWIRAHNVEQHYYSALAKSDKNFFHKIFHFIEAKKIAVYEKKMHAANGILAISKADFDYFKEKGLRTELSHPFHPFKASKSQLKIENYCLYHGNLSVSENEAAVDFLLKVFSNLNAKLIIAGKNPSNDLIKKARKNNNTEIIKNPSEETLKKLIQQAKVNCLPTFQKSGIKLKLIRSLIEGNEVIVNANMVEGTNLEAFCKLAETEDDWRNQILNSMQETVASETYYNRKKTLEELLNNEQNALNLMELLVLAP